MVLFTNTVIIPNPLGRISNCQSMKGKKTLLFIGIALPHLGLLIQDSATRCQLCYKFDSISALSNSIFDIIGLAQTSQEYHQRFLRTYKNQFLHKFHQNVIQFLRNQTNFWQFRQPISIFNVIRCWFKHVCNLFWVHI